MIPPSLWCYDHCNTTIIVMLRPLRYHITTVMPRPLRWLDRCDRRTCARLHSWALSTTTGRLYTWTALHSISVLTACQTVHRAQRARQMAHALQLPSARAQTLTAHAKSRERNVIEMLRRWGCLLDIQKTGYRSWCLGTPMSLDCLSSCQWLELPVWKRCNKSGTDSLGT